MRAPSDGRFSDSRRKGEWKIPVGLLLLRLVPVIAGAARVAELAIGGEVNPDNERFFDTPLPVVVHILSVTTYSLLGAFQFAPAFRRRNPRWQRAAGRILVPAGLISALSGLWLTLYYDLPDYDGATLGAIRVLVGSGMVAAIGLGVAAIRRRDYFTHGSWMIRAYALALGAGTQVLTHIPWYAAFGEPGKGPRIFLMGAGWAINVVLAEWIIRTRLTLFRPNPREA